jgi:hypothetical protein
MICSYTWEANRTYLTNGKKKKKKIFEFTFHNLYLLTSNLNALVSFFLASMLLLMLLLLMMLCVEQ